MFAKNGILLNTINSWLMYTCPNITSPQITIAYVKPLERRNNQLTHIPVHPQKITKAYTPTSITHERLAKCLPKEPCFDWSTGTRYPGRNTLF